MPDLIVTARLPFCRGNSASKDAEVSYDLIVITTKQRPVNQLPSVVSKLPKSTHSPLTQAHVISFRLPFDLLSNNPSFANLGNSHLLYYCETQCF